MRARSVTAAGLALAALVLVACQSTQDRSAELAKQGKRALSAKGLTINQTSSNVKVVGSSVVSDQNGTAAVIELRNNSQQALAGVPILIDVSNKKGKSVFRNNIPGLEASLTSAPLINPGQTFDWVHDQVLATGPATSVKAKVGQAKDTLPSQVPDLKVTKATISVDPVSGIEASGKITNNSGVEQKRLVVYGVARKGGKIVAAGRGVIQTLKTNGKAASYHIFFIGDPRGAELTVTAPPAAFK